MDAKNREQRRQYQKEWRLQNKERVRQSYKTYHQAHKEKINAASRRYNDSHKIERRATRKKYRENLKRQAFQHYGGAICICCRETHIEFLSIDHIYGGGTAHRRGISYGDFYLWLKNHNYPPGYRVLCMNCNSSLGYSGYCPHGNLKDSPKPLSQINLGSPSQDSLNTPTVSAHPSRNGKGQGRQLNLISLSDETTDSS